MAIPAHAKKVFEGVIFDVYKWSEKAFDGSTLIFEGLKRADTVSVIALSEGQAYYCWQEQPGREPFLSLFGGRVERGEDPLEGAKRELLEESGLVSDTWELLYHHPKTMGRIEFNAYCYIARDCRQTGATNPDSGEKIEVRTCGPRELVEKIITDEKFRDSELRATLFEAFDPTKAEELIKRIS
jgi:ADP-ribose pyrophosphatase